MFACALHVGGKTHIVCVIPLNSVKIAHRWKVRSVIEREKPLAGFDVDDSLYGNVALICQPMTALPALTHRQSL